MRLFLPAVLAAASVLAVPACSSTPTPTAPQSGAAGSTATRSPAVVATKAPTAAPTSTVLAFPKVGVRELARVTYPRTKTVVLRRVPSQRTYSIVLACSASDPKTPLAWTLLAERPSGPRSVNSGTIVCDGREDGVMVELPLVGGQIRIEFIHKSDKVTRAYAVLRSGANP